MLAAFEPAPAPLAQPERGNPPDCPAGHGPMVHVIISQDRRVLGCAWFCPMDGEEGRAYCPEAADCDCTPLEPLPAEPLIFEDIEETP